MVDRSDLVDPIRLSEAQIVIRGVALGPGESDKYAWVRVQVLATIKNAPNEELGQEILVAYYSGKPGLPDKACTIYLEPYSGVKDHHWKLLGGSATRGVSHVAP